MQDAELQQVRKVRLGQGEKRREHRGGRLESAKHRQCHGFAKSWRDKAGTWGLQMTKVTGWARRSRIWILSQTRPFFMGKKKKKHKKSILAWKFPKATLELLGWKEQVLRDTAPLFPFTQLQSPGSETPQCPLLLSHPAHAPLFPVPWGMRDAESWSILDFAVPALSTSCEPAAHPHMPSSQLKSHKSTCQDRCLPIPSISWNLSTSSAKDQADEPKVRGKLKTPNSLK